MVLGSRVPEPAALTQQTRREGHVQGAGAGTDRRHLGRRGHASFPPKRWSLE